MKFGICLQALNSADWARVLAEDWSRPPIVPDHQIWDENIALGLMAEPLGYDSIWTTEHHFDPHCMEPNPLVLLSYFAGATKRIEFGTMVIVLPWHHPLQVAEEIALFDILLQGRKLQIGVGRGMAQSEFESFGIDVNESRGRFVEGIEVVKLALTKERFSYEGEYYTIPETSARPRPRSTHLVDDMLGVFVSQASLNTVAECGLRPLFIAMQAPAMVQEQVVEFNGIRADNGFDPVQPGMLQWVYCAESAQQAEEEGGQYLAQMGLEAGYHYGPPEARKRPPEDAMSYPAEVRSDQHRKDLVECQIIGTPDECIEKVRWLQELTSCQEAVGVFHYGGMAAETANKSFRLFGEKVLPAVHKMATPFHQAAIPQLS